jgi:hypothetical protein
MGRRTGRKTPQHVGEARDVLGHEIELERFDGDEPIDLRLVRSKDRTENTAANLMQHTIAAECGWRGRTGGVFERQWPNS